MGDAFELLLVGNDPFLGKGGSQRIASFRPLLSRVTHNIALLRPSADKVGTFAAARFPDDAPAQAELRGLGQSVTFGAAMSPVQAWQDPQAKCGDNQAIRNGQEVQAMIYVTMTAEQYRKFEATMAEVPYPASTTRAAHIA